MKNKFKFLATMLIGILLSTNVWGADATPDYTLDATSSANKTTNSSYAGSADVTVGGITWNVKGNGTVNPWRVGGQNLSGVDREVYSKTAYGHAVDKIDLTIGTKTATLNSIKLIYSTNADFTSSTTLNASGTTASTTYTFAPTGGFPKNSYFKFVFNVTVSGGSNKYIEFSKVEIYNGSDAPAAPCTVTFEKGTGRCEIAQLTESSAGAGVTLPTAQASVGCAAVGWTFAGWATASQTETTTAPTLYAAGSNYKPSATCTLYAVYSLTPESPAGAASVGTVLWSEDWSGSSPLNNYDQTNFEGSIQNENLAGGNASPELLLKSKKSLTTTAAINLQGAKTLEATLYSNKNFIKINGNAGTNVEGKLYRYKWTVEDAVTSLNVTIASNGSENARVDDITLKVAAPDATYNSNPECAAPVRISWRVQSDQYAEDEINTQVTIVPANPNPAEYSCGENAVFVGWTTSDNYSNHSTAPTPLYKTEAEIKALVLTDDITFYAVFATKVIN